MKQIAISTLILIASIVAFPANAQSEELSEVRIAATIRTYVLRAPRPNAELVATFDSGAEDSAYGRDADGKWLRIMGGWVLAEVFNTEGEIGALPDTTHSFLGITKAESKLYAGPSRRWFDEVGALAKGEHVLVIGRNEDSAWIKLPAGWVEAAHISADGDVSPLPVTPSGVIITAKTRTFILAEPHLSAEFVDVFEAGDEALAIGRAGDWIEISPGWVSAEAVDERGDVANLPFSGIGLPITLRMPRTTIDHPHFDSRRSGNLYKGDKSFVIGRNGKGDWLLTQSGWIFVVGKSAASRYILDLGDIMILPVIDGTATKTTSRVSTVTSIRPTPTPKPATNLDARAIRSLIIRHTDDIRILDIETAANATTIEYDLKPWPFVPNESIANEVAFKIICAIRNGQKIPNTLKFIGHTHFKSEVGHKFTGPSVEMHISAGNANRIVCRGNDPSDISWRRIASRYKSYPIPRGASIDYD